MPADGVGWRKALDCLRVRNRDRADVLAVVALGVVDDHSVLVVVPSPAPAFVGMLSGVSAHAHASERVVHVVVERVAHFLQLPSVDGLFQPRALARVPVAIRQVLQVIADTFSNIHFDLIILAHLSPYRVHVIRYGNADSLGFRPLRQSIEKRIDDRV
jgi:hypothetical protein